MSQAAHYLELAKKLALAADRASDPEIAAGFLELAGKWVRLAEAAGTNGDDDLPSREDPGYGKAASPAAPQHKR